MTIRCTPGGFKFHVMLDPEDGTEATATTTIKEVTNL
jgi:hypothetical protein